MRKLFDYSKYKKYNLKYDYSKYDPNRFVIVLMKCFEDNGCDDVQTEVLCRILTDKLRFPTDIHRLSWAMGNLREDQLSRVASEFDLTIDDFRQVGNLLHALHTPILELES